MEIIYHYDFSYLQHVSEIENINIGLLHYSHDVIPTVPQL